MRRAAPPVRSRRFRGGVEFLWSQVAQSPPLLSACVQRNAQRRRSNAAFTHEPVQKPQEPRSGPSALSFTIQPPCSYHLYARPWGAVVEQDFCDQVTLNTLTRLLRGSCSLVCCLRSTELLQASGFPGGHGCLLGVQRCFSGRW